jgi:hypothetical protein
MTGRTPAFGRSASGRSRPSTCPRSNLVRWYPTVKSTRSRSKRVIGRCWDRPDTTHSVRSRTHPRHRAGRPDARTSERTHPSQRLVNSNKLPERSFNDQTRPISDDLRRPASGRSLSITCMLPRLDRTWEQCSPRILSRQRPLAEPETRPLYCVWLDVALGQV